MLLGFLCVRSLLNWTSSISQVSYWALLFSPEICPENNLSLQDVWLIAQADKRETNFRKILLFDHAEEKKNRAVFCILFWSPIPTCMCVCVCGMAGAGGVFPTIGSNLSTQRWHQIPKVKCQSYRLLPHFRHQSQAQHVCF